MYAIHNLHNISHFISIGDRSHITSASEGRSQGVGFQMLTGGGGGGQGNADVSKFILFLTTNCGKNLCLYL